MNFEEFLEKKEESTSVETVETPEQSEEEFDSADITENIDVQKAVVESLAADKAVQDEKISELEKENSSLKADKEALERDIAALRDEIDSLKAKLVDESEVNSLKKKLKDSGQSAANRLQNSERWEMCSPKTPRPSFPTRWRSLTEIQTSPIVFQARRANMCSKLLPRRGRLLRPKDVSAAPNCLKAC